MNTSFLIDLCEDMVFSPKPTPTIHGPPGGGGVLQISSDMDDQMGTKIETQIFRLFQIPQKIPT